MNICKDAYCTGCGVCESVCPVNSISMVKDEYDCIYPQIDQTSCIKCKKCINYCPKEKHLYWEKAPDRAYVAWNTDQQKREKAASGGVASAIYDYALLHGYKTFGVVYNPREKAEYIEIKNEFDIERCRNSKYVFSDIRPILPLVAKYVDNGEKIIIPALPCQAAAIIAICGGRRDSCIILDIVCHGTCPEDYLNQHIDVICRQKRKNVASISFRDDEYGTHSYVFTMSDNEKKFYATKVDMQDVYQIGYHRALIYRENCYHCEYAQPRRVGDLTISDFSGLGRVSIYQGTNQSVSCILVSSFKGQKMLEELIRTGYIRCAERPIAEALEFEKLLQRPSVLHKKRDVFLEKYKQTKDFECAAKAALKKELLLNRVKYREIKRFMIKHTPKKMRLFIKERLHFK